MYEVYNYARGAVACKLHSCYLHQVVWSWALSRVILLCPLQDTLLLNDSFLSPMSITGCGCTFKVTLVLRERRVGGICILWCTSIPSMGNKDNLSSRNQANHWQCDYINNSLHLCTKICSDICLRTLSVLRMQQFSDSVARCKLWALSIIMLCIYKRGYFKVQARGQLNSIGRHYVWKPTS